jgi:hypothetical protein
MEGASLYCLYVVICYYSSCCCMFASSIAKERYDIYKKNKQENEIKNNNEIINNINYLVDEPENHIISMSEIDIPVKKMKISAHNTPAKLKYKPSERYIKMTQYSSLDVLYE